LTTVWGHLAILICFELNFLLLKVRQKILIQSLKNYLTSSFWNKRVWSSIKQIAIQQKTLVIFLFWI
jgi:hypothetical protein